VQSFRVRIRLYLAIAGHGPCTNERCTVPFFVLTGDFNLPDIHWTDKCREMVSSPSYENSVNSTSFLEILDDFNLDQLVMEPTCGSHILDLILTSQPHFILNYYY